MRLVCGLSGQQGDQYSGFRNAVIFSLEKMHAHPRNLLIKRHRNFLF